jgi:NADPH-dependent ferric siderophore reductase
MTEPIGRWELFPLVFRQLEVKRVERLTPRDARITFGGDDLAGFASLAPDDHVKLLFPLPGDNTPVVPTVGPNGMVFPEGKPRPPARDFTPRRYDAGAGELDLEFVLHGEGPAATWAANAAPGDLLTVGGPRGSYVIEPRFDWMLLAGDETTIPAMSRWLEIIPAGTRVRALVEVNDTSDELPMPSAANLDLTWLHRDGAAPGSTTLILDAIKALDIPTDQSTYFWLAGEATGLKAIRRHLVNERGVSKAVLNVNGHWKYQVADWDHHDPVDEDDAE